MDIDGLTEIRARVARMLQRLTEKAGNGTAWCAEASDGNPHRYVIYGVKDFEQVSDDVHSTFVWLWSIKDHMQSLAKATGRSPRWLEAQIDADRCLSVCADIANRAKHGGPLRHRRSGKDPHLGDLRYTIPQEAVARITVRAFAVETEIADAKLVEFEMPVLDAQGRTLGDAFHFLSAGVKRWEALLGELEHSRSGTKIRDQSATS